MYLALSHISQDSAGVSFTVIKGVSPRLKSCTESPKLPSDTIRYDMQEGWGAKSEKGRGGPARIEPTGKPGELAGQTTTKGA